MDLFLLCKNSALFLIEVSWISIYYYAHNYFNVKKLSFYRNFYFKITIIFSFNFILILTIILATNGTNGFIAEAKHNKVDTDENFNAKSHEKSIESENEMFVDDFEELKRQSELLANKKSVAANAQVKSAY